METNPTRMCELLVGLPDVNVIGVGDWPHYLRFAITTRAERPPCPGCDGQVWAHDQLEVELVDLPCFGRQTRLIWLKQQRWRCPSVACRVVTFVETDERIAEQRAAPTDRAGRWATFQVGHHGRAVSEVAKYLGCDWHTVMDAVVAHGRALIDDPNRIDTTTAVGLDEVLREIHTIDDPDVAAEFVAQLGIDLQDHSCPPEVQRLGRTIVRWRHQIAAWHQAQFTNGPTEAINNLVKRIKRVAFGISNWTNYRTRALLYAGRPDWSLPAATPR